MLSVLKGSESAARRAVRRLMGEGPCSAQNTSVLLAGPSGSPVEELADELLRFWMCPKKPEGAPYCGECTVCRTLQTRQAIDLLIIEPLGGQVIKIEQLLERPTTDKNAENRTPMSVFVRTRPLQAAKKVVWLRGVMAGNWTGVGAEYDAWRVNALAAVDKLQDETAVFSHFVAINAIVGLLSGDDRVVVFRPGHCSITKLTRAGGKLRVAELGSEAATVVT